MSQIEYTPDELVTARLALALHGYNERKISPHHRAVLRLAAADECRAQVLRRLRGKMMYQPRNKPNRVTAAAPDTEINKDYRNDG